MVHWHYTDETQSMQRWQVYDQKEFFSEMRAMESDLGHGGLQSLGRRGLKPLFSSRIQSERFVYRFCGTRWIYHFKVDDQRQSWIPG
jgi:hypothetical protein